MADQKSSNSTEDVPEKEAGAIDNDDPIEYVEFSVESEEEMDENERKQWAKDAKKYENLIDQLFEESDD